MNYRQELLSKIQNLVSEKYTVQEFENDYYHYYLDQVPANTLSIIEDTFFGLVQENLDWTSENRTEDDKKEGWFNYSEYVDWVRKNVNEFLENEKTWYQNYTATFKE